MMGASVLDGGVALITGAASGEHFPGLHLQYTDGFTKA